MRNVILNTSPIQYLYQLDKLDLLHVYGRVIVPQSVLTEIQIGKQNNILLPNIEDYNWIEVKHSTNSGLIKFPAALGKGEKEAIALSLEINNCLLILDDMLARQYAIRMNIKITGTLGVLLRAKELGVIKNIFPLLKKLNNLGFRMSQNTVLNILKIAKEE